VGSIVGRIGFIGSIIGKIGFVVGKVKIRVLMVLVLVKLFLKR